MTKSKARSEGPTTHYIWRTRGDGKVRPSHRANNGRIFAWKNPPPTGHPGEDFGCRCRAEAHYPGVNEFARQTLISAASDAAKKWDNWDLLVHFVTGKGAGVTLSQIGHLRGIIAFYANTLGIYERVNGQIADAARDAGTGAVRYTFGRTYNFQRFLYSFRRSTVSGVFSGTASREGAALKISGTVTYKFHDYFTDPADLRQLFSGTSDPAKLSFLERLTEFGGTFYSIDGTWRTSYRAVVNVDRAKSSLHK